MSCMQMKLFFFTVVCYSIISVYSLYILLGHLQLSFVKNSVSLNIPA